MNLKERNGGWRGKNGEAGRGNKRASHRRRQQWTVQIYTYRPPHIHQEIVSVVGRWPTKYDFNLHPESTLKRNKRRMYRVKRIELQLTVLDAISDSFGSLPYFSSSLFDLNFKILPPNISRRCKQKEVLYFQFYIYFLFIIFIIYLFFLFIFFFLSDIRFVSFRGWLGEEKACILILNSKYRQASRKACLF